MIILSLKFRLVTQFLKIVHGVFLFVVVLNEFKVKIEKLFHSKNDYLGCQCVPRREGEGCSGIEVSGKYEGLFGGLQFAIP